MDTDTTDAEAPPDPPAEPAHGYEREGAERRRPPRRPAHPGHRVRAPWTRVLFIGVVAFLVWLVLDANTLQHNATVQPVGARRTVALDVLGPLAAVTRGLQISRLASSANEALGRTGQGAAVAGVTLRTEGPRPLVHRSHRPGPGQATTTTAPATLDPTPANPLRVLIIGDSIGLDLGGALQNDLANTDVVQATLDGRESTGLTRPDYFDWPAELQSDLTRVNPQLVVIMMGANDPQDFIGPPDIPYGTAQWDQIYEQRVAQFMAEAKSGGAKVVWVGMPPMQDPGRSAAMAHLNAIDQAQAQAQKPPVLFVPSWTVLGTPTGGYTPFITNGAGQAVNVRTTDGTHLTPDGSEILSQAVQNAIKTQLHVNI
jgi:hypothetical protein